MVSKTAKLEFEQGCALAEDGKYTQAFKFFLKAAKHGCESSQLNIGNFYSDGSGCKKNSQKAVYWYKRAFRSGHVKAAINLGIHYVEHNRIKKAKYWFGMAAKMGDEGAVEELKLLSVRVAMRKKLPYSEGDCFLVPLENGGRCMGVIARVPRYGRIMLGYFFKEKISDDMVDFDLSVLQPHKARLVVVFEDLHLISRRWPIIGRISPWKREDWPMTFLLRKPDRYKGEWEWSFQYSYDDPVKLVRETNVPPDTNIYRRDIICSVEAVEAAMDIIINKAILD